MQVPTVKTMLVFFDEYNDTEIGRSVIDFIEVEEFKTYEIDEIIIKEIPSDFYSTINYVDGNYLRDGSGTIEMEDIHGMVIHFTYSTVLEFCGKYFALTEVKS